ncbi:ATP-binding protein [Streptomyces maoxianensis]|uniref:ATP-binding protein n=1 Tax=Streptomyces maoxianensis TaxID=1459942 RepID=A0ABV9G8T7_9ACTN
MTRRARIAVPADRAAVAFARDRVMAKVHDWRVPLGDEQHDAVKLVTSELITNAIVHTRNDEDNLVFVTVWLYLVGGSLRLDVYDGSSTEPERHDATPDDETGRGLVLVDTLAARTGWESTARGKKVWVEFDVPVPPRAPASTRRAELLRERVKPTMVRTYSLLAAMR